MIINYSFLIIDHIFKTFKTFNTCRARVIYEQYLIGIKYYYVYLYELNIISYS